MPLTKIKVLFASIFPHVSVITITIIYHNLEFSQYLAKLVSVYSMAL